MQRAIEYIHKAKILKQINSNKAMRYRTINMIQNLFTVLVSSFITFIGFSGIEKIHKYISCIYSIDIQFVEFGFNILVFLLLTLVILNLVFHFGNKQSIAEQSVIKLSNFINFIDDSLSQNGGSLSKSDAELIRQKYNMIAETIPSNSDNEFLQAKKDLQNKNSKISAIPRKPGLVFNSKDHTTVIKSLIRQNQTIIDILKTLHDVNPNFFLGGGALRNIVWDHMHGYKNLTPIEDVDIMYFDELNNKKENDIVYEKKLKDKIKNLTWSVKNQARMHTVNNDPPYESLYDAVSKFPETASAFVVRLTDENKYEFISPFGFTDLFRLNVTPTPHFINKIDMYTARITEKKWKTKWPYLRFIPETK